MKFKDLLEAKKYYVVIVNKPRHSKSELYKKEAFTKSEAEKIAKDAQKSDDRVTRPGPGNTYHAQSIKDAPEYLTDASELEELN